MESTPKIVPNSVPFGTLGALQTHREQVQKAQGPPIPETVLPRALDVGAERSLAAIVERSNQIQIATDAVAASQTEIRTDLPISGQVISHLTRIDYKGLGENLDVSV